MSVKSSSSSSTAFEELGGRAAYLGASSVRMSLSVCTLASTCTATRGEEYSVLGASDSVSVYKPKNMSENLQLYNDNGFSKLKGKLRDGAKKL